MKRPRLVIALAVTLPLLIAAVAFGGGLKAARTTPFGKAPAFVHSLSSGAARSTPAIAASTYTVVVSGLHAPRGLTFGPGDRLYVAEAGLGGTPSNPINFTGAIDEIVNEQTAHATLRTVVSRIASLYADGDILGLGGLSAHGNGGIYAIMGESQNATGNSAFGQLLKATNGGNAKPVANVGSVNYKFTAANPQLDPGGQYPDANPYGVLALPGHTYVVDAGANTLNEVFPNGAVKILAYFENNITADSTPTCIARGPDGALYIGTLSLVDSLVFGPSAIVYRIDPATLPSNGAVPIIGHESEWATGLWPINGCAFGPDGSLYVSELITAQDFSGGDVVKIPFNNPSNHISLTNQTLPFAAGVAVARDGTVYAVGLTVTPNGFVARLAGR
jgi:hypothetical protein